MSSRGRTSLVSVLLSTSTFTTVFPTTSTVTSSSAIASCTIAQSAQITCGDGYYNTFGSQWQEFCAASVSGGTVYSSGTGLSLRACMSGCAVNSQCTGVYWNSGAKICYLMTGDLTITSGGPYQAASRLSTDASPCVSSWVVTETGEVTSTGEVVYTITTTLTPSASTPPIPSSTPVSPSSIPVLPSSTPVSPSSIPVLPSSTPVSPSSIPVLPSSTPVLPSSIPVSPSSTPVLPSSTPVLPSSIPVSPSSIPVLPSSTPVSPSSTPVSSSSIPVSLPSTPPGSSSSTPLILSTSSILPSPVSSPVRLSSTPLIRTSTSRSLATGSPSIIPSGSSSVPSSGASSLPTGSNPSETQPNSSATSLASSTVTPGGSFTSTQSADGSSGGVPVTSTYTTTYPVTETRPGHHKTTYLTTETITRVTTICPEGSEATAPAHEGSGTAIAHTSVTQNANPQHTTTQTTDAPTRETQTSAYASSMTTSTIYVTEIDVITACPPSVHNCPVGQSSTYTTTKTVATQTTTYLVAVNDSAQASASMNTSGQPMISQSTDVSVQPATVPTLSLAQAIAPSHEQTGDHTLSAKPQGSVPSSSAQRSGFASSGSSQATAHVTMMNSVSGESTSATMSASGAVYTGEAPKMGPFSTLFTVLNVLLALLFL